MFGEYREHKASHTLVFRKNGKDECPRSEATEVRVKGHHYTTDIWWPWTESAQTIEMIEQVASAAFVYGRNDAQDDMRRALGLERDSETGFFRE